MSMNGRSGGYFDEMDGVEEEPELPPLEEPSESSQWGQYSERSYAGWTYGWYAEPSEAGRRSFRREGEDYGSWFDEPTDPDYSQPWRNPYAYSTRNGRSYDSQQRREWDYSSAGNEERERQTFEQFDPWANYVPPEASAAHGASPAPPPSAENWSTHWRNGSWWNTGDWWSGSNDPGNTKDKDDDPPGWNGKTPSLKDYLRQISVWLAATRVDPTRRGVKLLAKLEGDAFEKMSLVDPMSLKTPDGVAKFVDLIRKRYEPLENYRVGRIMDQFMYEFNRKPEEEILDYNTRFDRELAEVEKVAGPLAPTWKAHLYLKKMRLREDKESQVLTGALGKYEYEALRNSAMAAFPSVVAIRSLQPSSSKPHYTRYQKQQKSPARGKPHWKKSRPHKANETHQTEEDDSGSEEDEEDSGDEDDQSDESEHEAEEDDEVPLPDELTAAMQESQAFVTQAKKQRADVVKARGFFKKGSDPKEREERIKKMKQRLPCAVCGQLGHWKDDRECPKKKSQGKPYKNHMVLLKDHTKPKPPVCPLMLVDTACAKTVAGTDWEAILRVMALTQDITLVKVPEREPFRFGPGKTIDSEYALLVPMEIGNRGIILRVSIVDRNVPCLLSRRVLKRLGAVVDLDSDILTLKRLGCQTPLLSVDAHVAIDVRLIKSTPQDAPEAFAKATSGMEVVAVDNELEAKLPSLTFTVQTDHPISFDLAGDISSFSDSSSSHSSGSGAIPKVRKLQKRHPRPRGAVFFKEYLPGWRARARSGSLGNNPVFVSHRLADGLHPRSLRDQTSFVAMASRCPTGASTQGGKRSGETPRSSESSSLEHLEYEEGRIDRESDGRSGDYASSRRKHDSRRVKREVTRKEGRTEHAEGSSMCGPSRSGKDDEGSACSRVHQPRPSADSSERRKREGDTPKDDRCDPRGRGESQACSSCESSPNTQSEAESSSEEEQKDVRPRRRFRMGAVLKWARTWVAQAQGRARRLVTRVLTVGTDSSNEEDKGPKKDTSEDELLSPRPGSQVLSVRSRENLLKGIRGLTAVFLLEAAVQAQTGSGCWWSRRVQGGAQADLMELACGHNSFTNVFYEHGWLCASPENIDETYQAANSPDVFDRLVQEVETLCPKLLVMRYPTSFLTQWNRLCRTARNHAQQVSRLREKQTRLATLFERLIDVQQENDCDFLLEVPSLLRSKLKALHISLQNRDEIYVFVRDSAVWLTSSVMICQEGSKSDQAYTVAEAAERGFRRMATEKHPQRLANQCAVLDQRIRGEGLCIMPAQTEVYGWIKDELPKISTAHVIVKEGEGLPKDGLWFDLDESVQRKTPKALLDAVRRLHINCGHPPNADLERVVRLSGGSREACLAVRGIRCSICDKAQKAKPPRPVSLKKQVGQFNEVLYGDLVFTKDADAVTHGFMVLTDEGTDFTVVKYMPSHKPVDLYAGLENAWIAWAGPPDSFLADGERGFSSQEFTELLAKAGTTYTPSAAYAPWQKGRVERKGQSVKSIIRKMVLHMGLRGPNDMISAGWETAAALNQRPGASGVSAAMMLFGQRLRLYGELYADGEPIGHHPEADNPQTALARRFKIRTSARQAVERYHAKELVRRAASSRTRIVTHVAIGERVFFYRDVISKPAQRRIAQCGKWLGPAIVIGLQGRNAWLSYAGRCYLVALEHIRGLAPDEIVGTRPIVQESLEELQRAAKAKDYIDLTQQQSEGLEQALQVPVGDSDAERFPFDDMVEPIPAVASTEMELLGEHEPPQGVAEDLPSASLAESRVRPRDDSESPAGRITWVPEGEEDNLRWKRQRVSLTEDPEDASAERPGETSEMETADAAQVLTVSRQTGILSSRLKKKLLDREVPYHEIPVNDRILYHEAEKAEWASWVKTQCVRVVKRKEAAQLQRQLPKSRFIRMRFVYRDKNASLRTPQLQLPVKAKARLCAQASREPLAMAGLLKLDSPTVQRIGVMIFIQLVLNLGWTRFWYLGDISTAFLQGKPRDVATRGRLFLIPPSRPLDGVEEGDILEVLKSVYGLPDAPRAWYEELTTFLKEIGFQSLRFDPAYMVHYRPDQTLGAMIIMHVDDIQIAHDGSPEMAKLIDKLKAKYSFGQWSQVSRDKEVTYTGRQIRLVNSRKVEISQAEFVKGRMENLKVPRDGKPDGTPLSAEEHAEFRSAVGNLHWLTSQTRPDFAVATSRFQKRQNNPTRADLKELAKVIREVKKTKEVSLTLQRIDNPTLVVFSDSSLYGSEGELLQNGEIERLANKHKAYSQAGALLTLMDSSQLHQTTPVSFSILDWRSRASKRVLHSTFAAETQAALEAIGMAKYTRAYFLDVLLGAGAPDVLSFDETHMSIRLITDCRSLYDHLSKDGAVPDDRLTAISTIALRGELSGGPERDQSLSEVRWVPSRWQLADCLTKLGLSQVLQTRLRDATTLLHEQSEQSIRRENKKGSVAASSSSGTFLCYSRSSACSPPSMECSSCACVYVSVCACSSDSSVPVASSCLLYHRRFDEMPPPERRRRRDTSTDSSWEQVPVRLTERPGLSDFDSRIADAPPAVVDEDIHSDHEMADYPDAPSSPAGAVAGDDVVSPTKSPEDIPVVDEDEESEEEELGAKDEEETYSSGEGSEEESSDSQETLDPLKEFEEKVGDHEVVRDLKTQIVKKQREQIFKVQRKGGKEPAAGSSENPYRGKGEGKDKKRKKGKKREGVLAVPKRGRGKVGPRWSSSSSSPHADTGRNRMMPTPKYLARPSGIRERLALKRSPQVVLRMAHFFQLRALSDYVRELDRDVLRLLRQVKIQDEIKALKHRLDQGIDEASEEGVELMAQISKLKEERRPFRLRFKDSLSDEIMVLYDILFELKKRKKLLKDKINELLRQHRENTYDSFELDSRYRADLRAGVPRRVARDKLRQRIRAAAHREALSRAEAPQRTELLRRQERDFMDEEPQYEGDYLPHGHIEDDREPSPAPLVRKGRVGRSREEQKKRRREHVYEREPGSYGARVASTSRVGARVEKTYPNPQPRRMEKKGTSQAAAARKKEKRKERRLRDKERKLVMQKTKQEEKKRRHR